MNSALALNNPIRKQLRQQLSTRIPFPEGHVIGIAYAKVLGPRKAITPEGHPIQVGTTPFDLTTTTPQQAIASAAHIRHGIVPHIPHWQLISEYDVTPQALERHRLRYSKVFVLEYVHERQRRADLGINDDVLDSFKNSWYLQRSKEAA